jgi:hypothetical protein
VTRFEVRGHEWDVNATVHGLRYLDLTLHTTEIG